MSTAEATIAQPASSTVASSPAARRSTILLTSLSGQLGGLELRLADEARLLESLGHAAPLALSRFEQRDAWFASLKQEGLSIADYEPPPFFEQWRWRRLNLLRAHLFWPARLRRAAPDLVHVAYAWTQTGGSRLWLAGRCGVPAVVSVHNTFPPARLSGWHERLARQAFRSVRGVYGVSDSALKAFQAIYGEFLPKAALLRTIHNFVDTDRFVPSPERRASARAALGIAHEAPVIGSVARLDEQKEPMAVLRVFDRVARRHPGAHLVFVGQGPLQDAVASEARRQPWGAQVHFTGFRNDAEELYPALDAHVLLSRQEGFGISTVEALACGIPAVCTDVPGSRDVLSGCDAGTLVPYADDEAAARALTALFDEPSRRACLAKAARRHAAANFSRERWAAELTQFYGEVLA